MEFDVLGNVFSLYVFDCLFDVSGEYVLLIVAIRDETADATCEALSELSGKSESLALSSVVFLFSFLLFCFDVLLF